MIVSDKLINEPAIELITLSEMKEYARVLYDAEDQLLVELIKSAREWCEDFTGIAFITQQRQASYSVMPNKRELSLSRGPLQSVTQIQIFNRNAQATDFDVDNIYVDTASVPGRIVLHDNVVWPPMQRAANGMVIDYVAGYGNAGSDVPAPIRLAIKQLVLHWFENRELCADGAAANRAPMTVEVLLQNYRVLKIGATCA